MSKYKTSIPVDVQAVKDALPQGAFFEKAQFNPQTNTVEVLWEHDPWKTGYTFPVEMSIDKISLRATEDRIKALKNPPADVQTPQTSPLADRAQRGVSRNRKAS